MEKKKFLFVFSFLAVASTSIISKHPGQFSMQDYMNKLVIELMDDYGDVNLVKDK